MPPKVSQKLIIMKLHNIYTVSTTTLCQKPKKPTHATWQATTKTEMSWRHYYAIKTSQNPQNTSIICTSFGMWSTGPT